MTLSELDISEYPPYYQAYFKNMKSDIVLLEELEASHYYFIKFVQDIPMDRHDYRYATGKWTIKEIIQHLIDSERVFAYRALRFARNDKTELSGYDVDEFAANAMANQRHLKDLLQEFSLVRLSTLEMFKSFSDEVLKRFGTALGYNVTVRGLGFMIIAHQEHHKKVFIERYL